MLGYEIEDENGEKKIVLSDLAGMIKDPKTGRSRHCPKGAVPREFCGVTLRQVIIIEDLPDDFADQNPLVYALEGAEIIGRRAATSPDDMIVRLEACRRASITAVKAAAEKARLSFITAGDGKAKAYDLKAEELAAYRAAESAGSELLSDNYPLAADRAALLQLSLADVMAEWEALGAGWRQAARTIEALEEAAVMAISKAADKATIKAASVIDWPQA